MADKKVKRPTGTTPRGTFAYPKLNKPDFGSEQYPSKCKQGEFSVQLIFDENDQAFQQWSAGLQKMHDAAVESGQELFKELKAEARKKLEKKQGGLAVNDLYTQLLDKETEEPTGKVKMKFSMDAGGERKKDGTLWTARPAIFDAFGKPLPMFFNAPGKAHHLKPRPDAPQIWGGTVGKVSYEIGTFDDGLPGYFVEGTAMVGLKLKLQAVQIISLVSSGQRDAGAYGFGSEDGGFAYSAEDDDAPTPEGDGGKSTEGSTEADDGNF
jgi:hypothetical protein